MRVWQRKQVSNLRIESQRMSLPECVMSRNRNLHQQTGTKRRTWCLRSIGSSETGRERGSLSRQIMEQSLPTGLKIDTAVIRISHFDLLTEILGILSNDVTR